MGEKYRFEQMIKDKNIYDIYDNKDGKLVGNLQLFMKKMILKSFIKEKGKNIFIYDFNELKGIELNETIVNQKIVKLIKNI